MRLTRPWMIAGLILMAPGATGAQAQLLPPVGQVAPNLLGRVGGVVDGVRLERLSPSRIADRLAGARVARIDGLLRAHGDRIELDDRREPARRGVILLTGADAATLEALRGGLWRGERNGRGAGFSGGKADAAGRTQPGTRAARGAEARARSAVKR